MSKQTQFSPEVHERAVRIVQEQPDQYPSLWAAAVSLGPKFDCAPSTLVGWVRRWKVDMFDLQSKRAVWRGTVSGTIPSSSEKLNQGVQEGITKLFEAFPPGSGVM